MIPASNLLAYLVGPIALTQPPWLAVAVSVTAVVLLGTRQQLHRLTSVVPQNELLTAGKFLILVWDYPAARSEPTGDVGNASHAIPRLARCSCGLHTVLPELLVAKVCARTEHELASGDSRRDLLIYGNDGCTCQAPTGGGRRPPGSCGGNRGRDDDDVLAPRRGHRALRSAPRLGSRARVGHVVRPWCRTRNLRMAKECRAVVR
jgi:hypothetical protein